MGNSILSRNNSGGVVERIGDIRLSTRDSLGEKWVLADGRVDPNADNSDYIEPEFGNIECWDSSRGFNQIIGDPSFSVYAGDGIWYLLAKNGGSSGLSSSGDIYKYNINTGSCTILISDVYQYNETPFIQGIHFDKVTKNIVLEEIEYNESFSLDFIYFDLDGNFIKKIAGPSYYGKTNSSGKFIASYNGVAYNAIYYYSDDVTYSWWIDIYADSTLLLSFNSWMGEDNIYHKIVPLYYNNTLYMAFISPVAYCNQTIGSVAWWNGQYHHLYKVEGSELVSVATMTMSSSFDFTRGSWDDLNYFIYGEGKLFVWLGTWSSVCLTLAFNCETETITHPYSGSNTYYSNYPMYYWDNKIYMVSSDSNGICSFSDTSFGDITTHEYPAGDDPRYAIIGNPQDQYDSGCFLTSKVDTSTGRCYVFNSNAQPECLPSIQIENTNAFIKVKE